MNNDKKKKRLTAQREGAPLQGTPISASNLSGITGGHEANDYYDDFACFTPMPDRRCHIREGSARCIHLSIEPISDAGLTEKYRYVCAKGCFDYVSSNRLH